MSRFNQDINECIDELKALFNEHRKEDDLNPYIVKRRPLIKLEVDLEGCVSYCYTVLKDIVKRYKVAPLDETDFIKSDVKRICVLLFKPYFKEYYWLKEACRRYEKESTQYKLEHNITDLDPPDDIYNSVIIYLKDFVINLSI